MEMNILLTPVKVLFISFVFVFTKQAKNLNFLSLFNQNNRKDQKSKYQVISSNLYENDDIPLIRKFVKYVKRCYMHLVTVYVVIHSENIEKGVVFIVFRLNQYV